MRQRKRMKKYFIFKKYEWRNNGGVAAAGGVVADGGVAADGGAAADGEAADGGSNGRAAIFLQILYNNQQISKNFLLFYFFLFVIFLLLQLIPWHLWIHLL